MGANDTLIPDPRSLPDNANLPTVNQPATMLGVTISFLVCILRVNAIIVQAHLLTVIDGCCFCYKPTTMGSVSRQALGMG